MDCYMYDNVLCISATNLEEYERLATKAKAEAQQLSETIDELKRFDIKLVFEASKKPT